MSGVSRGEKALGRASATRQTISSLRILTLQIEIERFEVYRVASQTGPHGDSHFASLWRSKTRVKSSLFARSN